MHPCLCPPCPHTHSIHGCEASIASLLFSYRNPSGSSTFPSFFIRKDLFSLWLPPLPPPPHPPPRLHPSVSHPCCWFLFSCLGSSVVTSPSRLCAFIKICVDSAPSLHRGTCRHWRNCSYTQFVRFLPVCHAVPATDIIVVIHSLFAFFLYIMLVLPPT